VKTVEIKGFEALTENQFKITRDAIAWITLLIAGADGKIDDDEIAWAKKVTKIRGFQSANPLVEFYDIVGEEYQNTLKKLLADIPPDVSTRNTLLSNRLSQLNEILPKLEDNMGFYLLNSYRSLAKHVARASGGFLGFWSIGKEENQLIDLPMLDDISFDDELDG